MAGKSVRMAGVMAWWFGVNGWIHAAAQYEAGCVIATRLYCRKRREAIQYRLRGAMSRQNFSRTRPWTSLGRSGQSRDDLDLATMAEPDTRDLGRAGFDGPASANMYSPFNRC
jgi:hypothetical protein